MRWRSTQKTLRWSWFMGFVVKVIRKPFILLVVEQGPDESDTTFKPIRSSEMPASAEYSIHWSTDLWCPGFWCPRDMCSSLPVLYAYYIYMYSTHIVHFRSHQETCLFFPFLNFVQVELALCHGLNINWRDNNSCFTSNTKKFQDICVRYKLCIWQLWLFG